MGRLWIGHQEGLDVFDPRTESFLYHWYDSLQREKGLSVTVRKIQERKDGKVWICSNQGLYIGDPRVLKIQKNSNLPDDISYNSVTESPDGSTWFATRSGLIRYDSAADPPYTTYLNDPQNPKSISSNLVTNVFLMTQ